MPREPREGLQVPFSPRARAEGLGVRAAMAGGWEVSQVP